MKLAHRRGEVGQPERTNRQRDNRQSNLFARPRDKADLLLLDVHGLRVNIHAIKSNPGDVFEAGGRIHASLIEGTVDNAKVSSVEVRVKFFENLDARLFGTHCKALEHAPGYTFIIVQQAQQEMLSPDIGVIEGLGFLGSQCHDMLHAGRIRNASDYLLLRTSAHLLLHFLAYVFQIESELVEHIYRNALPEPDQAQQEMLGADEVVIESVRFLAGQRQDLSGAGREVRGDPLLSLLRIEQALEESSRLSDRGTASRSGDLVEANGSKLLRAQI